MRPKRRLLRAFSSSVGAVIAAVGLLGPSAAWPQNGDDARDILRAMSDYVAGQKSISATFNTDIEVITSDLQKIQFDSSGQLQLARPGPRQPHRRLH